MMCEQAECGTSCNTIAALHDCSVPAGRFVLEKRHRVYSATQFPQDFVLNDLSFSIEGTLEQYLTTMPGVTIYVLLDCSVLVCLREVSSSNEWTLVERHHVDKV